MGERPLIAPMRWILIVGGLFVLAAGIQLYPLAEHTDQFFAWTIAVPATAAFLGASYWGATVFALLAARERTWARARVGVPGVLVFVWLTLLLTLLHLDAFHLDKGDLSARVVAWVWLVIYVVEPPVLLWIFIVQLRVPGEDPPRSRPIPGWFRRTMAVEAALLLIFGAALYVAPGDVGKLWPWPLTDLTAMAIAAWLVALGLLLAAMIWENDWRRVGLGMLVLITLAPLLALALALYPEGLEWDASMAVYLASVAIIFATGAFGGVVSRRTQRAPG
jgi:hypothetical protein